LLKAAITSAKSVASEPVQMPSKLTVPDTLVFGAMDLAAPLWLFEVPPDAAVTSASRRTIATKPALSM